LSAAPQKRIKKKKEEKRRKKKKTMTGLLLVLAILLVLGGFSAFMFRWAARAQRHLAEAGRWIEVQATIVRSQLVRNATNGAHWPSIHYRYEIDGVAHEGSRWNLVQENLSRPKALALLEKYPLNARVSAWVNPEDHAHAVLERTGDVRVLKIIAWIFAALAVVFTVFASVRLGVTA